ncbi:MAG: succinate dehydrogenase/fumarate reductase iron-sulfur subunit [Solirubrobacterales bacterium]|nr:succinate dehydrogenase/fumarate reductase iron-sulfur subunit [Solirubrobacterales bacterium]
MTEFTLKLRRYNPELGDAPYWEDFTVDLEPHRSVLEGILQAKATLDGSIGIRCSCRAAICGSCGVRINGNPGLACHMHLDQAQKGARGAAIEVEPMGNMPVIKDLIVDMDAVHWSKISRVTPWLINKEPIPQREYVVPHESMVDVTQSMACIQCGACVSDCLSMEVDPLFIGPAALAKAYRFVGDPRDAGQRERLRDLAEDPHGIYDCTHCFKCIEACPKGVAPMNQIMRLRRVATRDQHITDRNNGKRHEDAFVSLVRDHAVLWEAELLARSHGGNSALGKFAPAAGLELVSSLPVIAKALLRRKVAPGKALRPPHDVPKADRRQIKRLVDKVEGREEQVVLNLYISGYDDEPSGAGSDDHQATVQAGADGDGGMPGTEPGTPGLSAPRSPSR